MEQAHRASIRVCCICCARGIRSSATVDPKKIWQTLIDCRNKGKANLETISQLVAPRIPMEVESCHRYLKNIEHNLDSNHQMALKTFFQYLIERNDGSKEALPLKFFPNELRGAENTNIP